MHEKLSSGRKISQNLIASKFDLVKRGFRERRVKSARGRSSQSHFWKPTAATYNQFKCLASTNVMPLRTYFQEQPEGHRYVPLCMPTHLLMQPSTVQNISNLSIRKLLCSSALVPLFRIGLVGVVVGPIALQSLSFTISDQLEYWGKSSKPKILCFYLSDWKARCGFHSPKIVYYNSFNLAILVKTFVFITKSLS